MILLLSISRAVIAVLILSSAFLFFDGIGMQATDMMAWRGLQQSVSSGIGLFLLFWLWRIATAKKTLLLAKQTETKGSNKTRISPDPTEGSGHD